MSCFYTISFLRHENFSDWRFAWTAWVGSLMSTLIYNIQYDTYFILRQIVLSYTMHVYANVNKRKIVSAQYRPQDNSVVYFQTEINFQLST